MSRLYGTQAEIDLVDVIRGGSAASHAHDTLRFERLVRAAREHGVEGFLPVLAHDPREIALRLQYEARATEVRSIGAAFAAAKIECVLLKGVGLAERFYERPWTRGSTDIDLLVTPERLDAALDAIGALGYTAPPDVHTDSFRRRHFNVETTSRIGTLAEVHFLAYRGFGSQITASDLFVGRLPLAGFPGLAVAPPAAELVYLAAHAAAHRFARMGWLVDILLMLRHASPSLIDEARTFATRIKFAEVLEAALLLLRTTFGVSISDAESSRSATARVRAAVALAKEPRRPVLRSATRFLYTTLLCDGVRERIRYTSAALQDRSRFVSE